MQRILIYDREANPLGEINPNNVLAAVLREEINGEHSLEITTTQVLEKGTRLLHRDGRGIVREFSVSGVDADHVAGVSTVGTYYCPWSIQEDLMGVTVSVMPGVQTPVTASVALNSLLSSQNRWIRGTVTNTATGGASMYDRSAWEALSTLVEVWGGEVNARISANIRGEVTTRYVDLYTAQGTQTAKRRFDFGADAKGITRKLSDEPLYCRISPRGKGEETDAGGYGRKITIESVNDGKDYLEYAPMVDIAKLPNRSGVAGYVYPTKIVENSDCETPAALKAWAQNILADECTPNVTYEVDVLQSDEAGTSVQGVSLGDAVQVVDEAFGGDGLRIEARVTSITTDLVAERVEHIELGAPDDTISVKFEKVNKAVSSVANQLDTMATPQYVSDLLDRINQEINATGGYTYITEGQGLRTYDVAVSDPLVGAEASMVVEIKGGNIRIANSKTAQGEWEWKTILQSGHILAELVTAAQITTGYIGSASSGNYWNLDTGELRIVAQALNAWSRREQLSYGSVTLTEKSGWLNTVKTQQSLIGALVGDSATADVSGRGNMYIVPNMPGGATTSAGSLSAIVSKYAMKLMSGYAFSDARYKAGISLNQGGIELNQFYASGEMFSGILVKPGTVLLGAKRDDYDTNNGYRIDDFDAVMSVSNQNNGARAVTIHSNTNIGITSTYEAKRTLYVSGKIQIGWAATTDQGLYVYGPAVFQSNMTVHGTKNRLVETTDYSDRLLYCYETPTPYFGDIGSGTLDENGLCYVEIDDVFAETANTKRTYQVFLQACGNGNVWVEEKRPSYFVVRGTPWLAFDWEIKARQIGYEHTRIEQYGADIYDYINEVDLPNPEDAYTDYISEIEQALYA